VPFPSPSSAPLLLGFPGGMELLIILIIVLVLFGNRIPGLARSLGSGIREFKTGLKEGESGDKGNGESLPKDSPSQRNGKG